MQVDQARTLESTESTLKSLEPRQVVLRSYHRICQSARSTDAENGQSGGVSNVHAALRTKLLLFDCVHVDSVSGTATLWVIGCGGDREATWRFPLQHLHAATCFHVTCNNLMHIPNSFIALRIGAKNGDAGYHARRCRWKNAACNFRQVIVKDHA